MDEEDSPCAAEKDSNDMNAKLQSIKDEFIRFKRASEAQVAEMGNVIKLKEEDIEQLTRDSDAKITEFKNDIERKVAEMNNLILKIAHPTAQAGNKMVQYESRLKEAEIDNIKSAAEAKWKSAIDQMDSEIKTKDKELEKLKGELEQKKREFDAYKLELHIEKTSMEYNSNMNIANLRRIESESNDRIAQLEREAESNLEKLHAHDIAHQKAQAEMESKMKKMEVEAKLRTDEIENVKSTLVKAEAEWKSEIDRKESEITTKEKEIENISREFGKLHEKLKSSREEISRLKRESDVKIAEMESAIKSKECEIANFKVWTRHTDSQITKMENTIKAKECQIENFKTIQAEAKAVWSSEKTQMETEIKSQSEEIEHLGRKLEESREEIDRYKMVSNMKITTLEKKIESKDEEIEYQQLDHQNTIGEKEALIRKNEDEARLRISEIADLKKLVEEQKMRISQLEKEVEKMKIGENPQAAETASPVAAVASESDAPPIDDTDMLPFDEPMGSEDSEETPRKRKRGITVDDNDSITGQSTSMSGNAKISLDEASKMEIRASFSEISKITTASVYSVPTDFAGITWKIGVRKTYDDTSFVFSLDSENSNTDTWRCKVVVDFHLISHNAKEMTPIRREVKFDADRSCANLHSISNKDLHAKVMGFVKSDSIDAAVTIRMLPTN